VSLVWAKINLIRQIFNFGITDEEEKSYKSFVYLSAVLMPITCVKFIKNFYAHLDLSKLVESSTKTFEISKIHFTVTED
jgi:hypothetical protein